VGEQGKAGLTGRSDVSNLNTAYIPNFYNILHNKDMEDVYVLKIMSDELRREMSLFLEGKGANPSLPFGVLYMSLFTDEFRYLTDREEKIDDLLGLTPPNFPNLYLEHIGYSPYDNYPYFIVSSDRVYDIVTDDERYHPKNRLLYNVNCEIIDPHDTGKYHG
jgi:hypothetical protein